ncbi:hypothetical protein [Tessaracoccus coleopterorum]|uniref:hypothetical protein n=1 Tax=Tessaracoccus coleopterorum TaxID=2714950 RepID=UPI001E531560|nr:hypothetical protein [Tessaracoccus coleopterorum]
MFEIPFTDGRTLIENKQISDLDAQFTTLPYASKFNESLLAAGKGPDGHVYAIPAKNVYGWASTSTVTCSGRPGSIPTSRRPPGPRSARPPGRSPRQTPASPATCR